MRRENESLDLNTHRLPVELPSLLVSPVGNCSFRLYNISTDCSSQFTSSPYRTDAWVPLMKLTIALTLTIFLKPGRILAEKLRLQLGIKADTKKLIKAPPGTQGGYIEFRK